MKTFNQNQSKPKRTKQVNEVKQKKNTCLATQVQNKQTTTGKEHRTNQHANQKINQGKQLNLNNNLPKGLTYGNLFKKPGQKVPQRIASY
jgi:hypothetical protein